MTLNQFFDLIEFYIDNNICPVIETEFYSKEKLRDIDNLLQKWNKKFL